MKKIMTRSSRRLGLKHLALVLALTFFFVGEVPAGWLFIYHINVGQGDSTLIVSPTGKTLLVDGGNNGMGAARVVPLLETLKISHLNFIVATHYDADHIGGLDEVMQSVPNVDVVFDRGRPASATTRGKSRYKEYVEAAGTRRTEIHPGTVFDMGADVLVVCVAVNGQVEGGNSVALDTKDENDASVALKLRFGTFDYFVGGDLTGGGLSGSRRTKDVESLVAPVVGDVDVLKVSHHGSKTSSNQIFLDTLRPEVAVISAGNGGVNKIYHHPSRPVLNRLELLGALKAVFQTNRGETAGGLKEKDLKIIRIEDRNVVVSTDGQSYLINGEAFETDEHSHASGPGGPVGGHGNG